MTTISYISCYLTGIFILQDCYRTPQSGYLFSLFSKSQRDLTKLKWHLIPSLLRITHWLSTLLQVKAQVLIMAQKFQYHLAPCHGSDLVYYHCPITVQPHWLQCCSSSIFVPWTFEFSVLCTWNFLLLETSPWPSSVPHSDLFLRCYRLCLKIQKFPHIRCINFLGLL